MPVVGFLDASGKRLKFADIDRGIWDYPLPLVRWLASGFRAADHYGDENVLSATSLVAPPQIIQLAKRHDVYVKPLDNLWAGFGTVCHQLLELGAQNSLTLLREQKLVHEFEGQKIGGTVDLYDTAKQVGSDYKTTSAWSVRAMKYQGVREAKPEYYWQAQIYKALLYWVTGAKALRWELVAIARDYSPRFHGGKKDPIEPIEVIDLPLLPMAMIEEYIRERVVLHRAAAACDDEGLPACSVEETWGGKRCESYCNVNQSCYQWNTKLSGDAQHVQGRARPVRSETQTLHNLDG